MEAATKDVLSTALSAGASLAGVADLSLLRGIPIFGSLKLDSFKLLSQ